MKILLWKITKLLRGVKRKVKKIIPYTKSLLKSNKYIYRLSKKLLAVMKPGQGGKELPVKEIVYRMCPESEWKKQRDSLFSKEVRFSILVPLYNTPERFLREMIESVQYQSYSNWELCMADGSDEEHVEVEKICREYMATDSRIHYRKLSENKGISENTNACLEMATGDYIVLFDHDDFLHPSALYENAKVICNTDADFIYSDEAIFKDTAIFNIVTRHYKPDFAPDNLRSNNYICHLTVFSRELLATTGLFRAECDGSQDHDLILRLTEVAKKIYHIPEILYYWRSHSNSVAGDISSKQYAIDSAKLAISDHLRRIGLNAHIESTKIFPTFYRLRYELAERSKVSVIVYGKANCRQLKRCISSIIKRSSYDNYEIVVVGKPEYRKCLENYKNIVMADVDMNQTPSAIINDCVSVATGEYLIMFDSRNTVESYQWIEELLMYAQREDVAAVGAKIYHPDDTIYHGGIILGIGQNLMYAYQGADRDEPGYMGRMYYSQNLTAVSGVCMMTKAFIYNELGGFDETLPLDYADVDYCLKARNSGYNNVFNPYCQIYHYAKKTENKPCKAFDKKWCNVLNHIDPYYNPHFNIDKADYGISEKISTKERKK